MVQLENRCRKDIINFKRRIFAHMDGLANQIFLNFRDNAFSHKKIIRWNFRDVRYTLVDKHSFTISTKLIVTILILIIS